MHTPSAVLHLFKFIGGVPIIYATVIHTPNIQTISITKKAPDFSGAVFFSPFTRQVGEG
jgi:hypothetical protein